MHKLLSTHRHVGIDSHTGEKGDIAYLGKSVWFTSLVNLHAWQAAHPTLSADESIITVLAEPPEEPNDE